MAGVDRHARHALCRGPPPPVGTMGPWILIRGPGLQIDRSAMGFPTKNLVEPPDSGLRS